MAYSRAKLKSKGDSASPCLSPQWIGDYSSENSIAHSPMSQFTFTNGSINTVTAYCESTHSSCCSTSSIKSHCLVRNQWRMHFWAHVLFRDLSSKQRQVLDHEFVPATRRHRMLRNYWFMQDGAHPHLTAEVFDFHQATFRNRIVALDTLAFSGHGVEWSPYSSDFNPCDYFLWGYLKGRVFKHVPATLQVLRTVISRDIPAVENDVLPKVIMEFSTRICTFIAVEGKRLENLLY